MFNLTQIEPAAPSRRDLIKALAFAVVATGGVIEDVAAAQHAHEETAATAKTTGGKYQPKAMNATEYKTLERLAVIIVPADDVSGSGLDAGAPAFIDLLSSQNEQLADIFHGGLAWLDGEMNKRYEKSFVAATEMQQIQMINLLVEAERHERLRVDEVAAVKRSSDNRDFANYTLRPVHPLAAGGHFFDWVRKMTVDAFYTSPIGMKDLNFMGNKAYSKYEVPKESLEYALKRSPFA